MFHVSCFLFCFADVLGFNSEMLDFSSLGDALSAVVESSAATSCIEILQDDRHLKRRTSETFFEVQNTDYRMMLSIARFFFAKGIPISK
jgi:hypothetical protein